MKLTKKKENLKNSKIIVDCPDCQKFLNEEKDELLICPTCYGKGTITLKLYLELYPVKTQAVYITPVMPPPDEWGF